jgi:ectoine hydroxylase-related dioxygenase (phytanoyl-CoA dioxygenase family)
LRWDDAIVDRVLADARRRRAIASATGARDLRWISGYVSVKDAHTPPLGWHQDWWCWDHPVTFRPPAAQVAVLVYLTATSREVGALRVLPGSHRRSIELHATLAESPPEGAALPTDHPGMSDHPAQVTLSVRAGDAVVIDYRLLHATHANSSRRRRDCVLLSFAPSWNCLPRDVRSHLVQHLALPRDDERPPATGWTADLLPQFDGTRIDLHLSRTAPAEFSAEG